LLISHSSAQVQVNGYLRAFSRLGESEVTEHAHRRMTGTQSIVGLNAINFFQAEMVGVVLPALSAFLKEVGWRYDAIGIATALAGLGTLLLQIIAGEIIDRVSSRRFLFAAAAIITGLCFVAIPLVPQVSAGSTGCCLFRARYKASLHPCSVLLLLRSLGTNC
jgi:MFS family permease